MPSDNLYAAIMSADHARHRRVHPGVLENLLVTGQVTMQSRVLEVGCGTGNYIRELADATACHAVGIDPSAHMLEEARRQGGDVRYQIGSAETLAVMGAFDLVYSVDAIHHVRDHRAYITRAHGLLAPGGALCTATDSEAIIRAREPLAVYLPETVDADLARYPAVAMLRELMRDAGFEKIREVPVELVYEITDAGPYRDRAYSCLHLIPEEAFRRGLARLEADLEHGPVRGVARYVMLWGQRLG